MKLKQLTPPAPKCKECGTHVVKKIIWIPYVKFRFFACATPKQIYECPKCFDQYWEADDSEASAGSDE